MELNFLLMAKMCTQELTQAKHTSFKRSYMKHIEKEITQLPHTKKKIAWRKNMRYKMKLKTILNKGPRSNVYWNWTFLFVKNFGPKVFKGRFKTKTFYQHPLNFSFVLLSYWDCFPWLSTNDFHRHVPCHLCHFHPPSLDFITSSFVWLFIWPP